MSVPTYAHKQNKTKQNKTKLLGVIIQNADEVLFLEELLSLFF